VNGRIEAQIWEFQYVRFSHMAQREQTKVMVKRQERNLIKWSFGKMKIKHFGHVWDTNMSFGFK
jgi:hypothetical protein